MSILQFRIKIDNPLYGRLIHGEIGQDLRIIVDGIIIQLDPPHQNSLKLTVNVTALQIIIWTNTFILVVGYIWNTFKHFHIDSL